MPDLPRLRVKPPSHRQEIVEDDPFVPETPRAMSDWMQDMPESRRFEFRPPRLRTTDLPQDDGSSNSDIDFYPSPVTQVPRALAPFDARLTYEALAQTVPVRSETEIHEDDIPLAGYLLARRADQRPVESADLELLRDAHDSVREARNLMSLGRGNVKEDLVATKGLSMAAVAVVRRLVRDGDLSTTQAAVFSGAGNCEEYAQLAAQAMSNRMKPDIKARLTKRKFVDHRWVEAAPGGTFGNREQTVVMDSWRSGPAVFAPDGFHSSITLGLTTRKMVDLENKRYFTRELHGNLLQITKIGAQEFNEDNTMGLLPSVEFDPKNKLIWNDKSGVKQSFARRAASLLDKEVSPEHAYLKSEAKVDRFFIPKTGLKLTKIAAALNSVWSRKKADASVGRDAKPAPRQRSQTLIESIAQEAAARPQSRHPTLAQLLLQPDGDVPSGEIGRSSSRTLDQIATAETSPTRAENREVQKAKRPVSAALARKAGKQLTKVAKALGLGSSRKKSDVPSKRAAEPAVGKWPQTLIESVAQEAATRPGPRNPALAELFMQAGADAPIGKNGPSSSLTPEQLVPAERPPTREEIREAKQSQRPIPAALRSEIQAVRVARELAPQMKTADLARVAPRIVEAARTLGVPGPSKAIYPHPLEPQETEDAQTSALVNSPVGSRRESEVKTPSHGSDAFTPRSVESFRVPMSVAESLHESDDDLFDIAVDIPSASLQMSHDNFNSSISSDLKEDDLFDIDFRKARDPMTGSQ